LYFSTGVNISGKEPRPQGGGGALVLPDEKASGDYSVPRNNSVLENACKAGEKLRNFKRQDEMEMIFPAFVSYF